MSGRSIGDSRYNDNIMNPSPKPQRMMGGRGVVIGISSTYRSMLVHWACSVTAMQIYVSDDIAIPRGFVARLQISIKFKLS
jgi:hypothetical protein